VEDEEFQSRIIESMFVCLCMCVRRVLHLLPVCHYCRHARWYQSVSITQWDDVDSCSSRCECCCRSCSSRRRNRRHRLLASQKERETSQRFTCVNFT